MAEIDTGALNEVTYIRLRDALDPLQTTKAVLILSLPRVT